MQMQKYINVVAMGMCLDKRKLPRKDTPSLPKALPGGSEDDARFPLAVLLLQSTQVNFSI